MITAEYLRSRLSYCEDSGVFIWKLRADGGKGAHRWNVKNAGKVAGTLGKRGYFSIGIDSRVYQAHRLAWLYMYGAWPKGGLDHKDRVCSNNAKSNLREATSQQNGANRSMVSNNTSGVKGVHWNRKVKKWRAGIRVSSKIIHLGHFLNIDDAANAYAAAALKYFGDFSTGALRK